MIEITVLYATGVQQTNLVNNQTAYAVVSYGMDSFQTRIGTGSNAGVDPFWEKACFLFVKPTRETFDVTFRVKDLDYLTEDDILGQASIPVKAMMYGDAEFSLQMATLNDDNGGIIHCRSRLVDRQFVKRTVWSSLARVVDYNGDGFITTEELKKFLKFLEVDSKVADRKLADLVFAQVFQGSHDRVANEGALRALVESELPLNFKVSVGLPWYYYRYLTS